MPEPLTRCPWAKNERLTLYHDTEWGVPLHDDRLLLEHLILEGAHAGLSWDIVLKKREGYREAFANYDTDQIIRYDDAKIEALTNNPDIIRNRQKIVSAINNTKAFLKIQEAFGSFDRYLWQFVDGAPIINSWQQVGEAPATSPISDALSKDLKKRGFSFVGTTICYAMMQAVGLVDDHLVSCFRHTHHRQMS